MRFSWDGLKPVLSSERSEEIEGSVIIDTQKSKGKVKMTTRNAKIFDFCPVILHFYF